MKKALIIRHGAIGDVVETMGLAKALVNAGYSVHYLSGPIASELIKYNSYLDKKFVLEKKSYTHIFKMALKLNKENYDLVLNLQPSLRFRILCKIACFKKVFNYKKITEYHAVENFFNTGKNAIPSLELEKEINITIPDNIIIKMKSQLEDGKTHICFNTGANSTRQGRKWCVEYWTELAKLILEKYNAQIYIIGAKEDKENVQKILDKIPQIKSFAGETTLIETAALLASADIVISGDTGPIHIASAVGTRCIGLYGCCPVSRSGPYGEKHRTITSTLSCSPCNQRKCKYINSDIDDTPCMRDIKPEKVLNLVDTLLE